MVKEQVQMNGILILTIYWNLNMDIMYSLYIELVGTIDCAKNEKCIFMMRKENTTYKK